jgi:hypothetical protein
MKSVVVRETSPTTLVMRGATNDVDACQTALKEWLTHKAEERLIPWLKRISDEIGLSYSAVLIRQQQTRWGSCSVSVRATPLHGRAMVTSTLRKAGRMIKHVRDSSAGTF